MPKVELTLATKNPGKLREFEAMAERFSGPDAGLELVWRMAPAEFDPEETGKTFIENAVIKASAAASMTGMLSLADDSGMTVDALDGRPGIYSARYAPGTDRDRRLKLLDETARVPDGQRQAAFVCALALVASDGTVLYTNEIEWKGRLSREEKGVNGFGFDPIFIPDGYELTSAEISAEEKNDISHRSLAFKDVLRFMQGTF